MVLLGVRSEYRLLSDSMGNRAVAHKQSTLDGVLTLIRGKRRLGSPHFLGSISLGVFFLVVFDWRTFFSLENVI